ncbi:MAG: hypothetical protein AAB385_00140 [Planctomycetota bacterium]
MVARPKHSIDKVRELQRSLFIAAKGNRERRFHALYDRIWRSDPPAADWKRGSGCGATRVLRASTAKRCR